MTIEFQKQQIFYTTEGNGKPLVLLHGFLESSSIWRDFISEFSGSRQIITIDLPGHGQSACVGEVHSMEIMAAVVASVLQELNVGRVDLLGHSMGGYVALAFLENYRDKVNKLILLNSTPEADSKERKENRDRSIDLVKRNKQAFVKMAISNLLTKENNKKFKTELLAMKEEALNFPTEGIIAALQGMKNRTNRISLLREFGGAKILMAGEQDPILNYQNIKEVAKTCGCSFYTFKDGHLSFLENEKEFFETVHFIE